MDIFQALTMAGGLSLFLFGMDLMGEALERRAGGGLRTLLGRLTTGRAAGLLTGLGVFDKLAKRAGAGTLVPITGFANAVVSPALEFKSEGLVMGVAAKMFVIAGPVLVFGISASVLYGVILLLLNLT